jgi:hypothetical protein
MLASVISAVPLVSYAGSLECDGNIISPGATEQELLDACGEPTSRNGANWTYQVPGSISQVVTVGNGLIMFIRDADEAVPSGSPMGDHP